MLTYHRNVVGASQASIHPIQLVLATIVLVATACSNNESEGLQTSRIDESEDKQSLNLYSWDEYFNPDAIAEFERRYSVDVNYITYDNNDEMFETLKSSPHSLDVVVMDDSSMARAIDLRLIQQVDKALLANYDNIDSKYAPSNDRRSAYAVPYTWGTTLLAYRSDLLEVSEDQKSWKLLLDERVTNKVSLLDERLECFGVALRLNGHQARTDSASEIEEATNLLRREFERQGVKLGSDNDMKDDLRSGRSLVAMMYSGDAALIAEEGQDADFKVDFFIPKEGATLFTDGFAISRDSQAPELAHKFIDFMTEAKIAGETSNHLWYATPNKAALEGGFISEELANDQTIYPPASVLSNCDFAVEGSLARVQALNAGWKAVKELSHAIVDAVDRDQE